MTPLMTVPTTLLYWYHYMTIAKLINFEFLSGTVGSSLKQ